MLNKIEQKVHEIRKEPEHIRMRYVWVALFLSMSLIIFIWIMSMQTNFLQVRNDPDTQKSLDSLQDQLNTITLPPATSEESVSIDDLLEKQPIIQPEL